MQKGIQRIGEIVDLDVGKARVAGECRYDHVSVACKHGKRDDVIVGQRAADEPRRENNHRPAQLRIGPYRRFGAALHVRDRVAGFEPVVGARVAGRRRIAHQERIGNRLRSPIDEQLAIVGNLDVDDQRIDGIAQYLGDIALAVAGGNALPVVFRGLAWLQPAQVLLVLAQLCRRRSAPPHSAERMR